MTALSACVPGGGEEGADPQQTSDANTSYASDAYDQELVDGVDDGERVALVLEALCPGPNCPAQSHYQLVSQAEIHRVYDPNYRPPIGGPPGGVPPPPPRINAYELECQADDGTHVNCFDHCWTGHGTPVDCGNSNHVNDDRAADPLEASLRSSELDSDLLCEQTFDVNGTSYAYQEYHASGDCDDDQGLLVNNCYLLPTEALVTTSISDLRSSSASEIRDLFQWQCEFGPAALAHTVPSHFSSAGARVEYDVFIVAEATLGALVIAGAFYIVGPYVAIAAEGVLGSTGAAIAGTALSGWFMYQSGRSFATHWRQYHECRDSGNVECADAAVVGMTMDAFFFAAAGRDTYRNGSRASRFISELFEGSDIMPGEDVPLLSDDEYGKMRSRVYGATSARAYSVAHRSGDWSCFSASERDGLLRTMADTDWEDLQRDDFWSDFEDATDEVELCLSQNHRRLVGGGDPCGEVVEVLYDALQGARADPNAAQFNDLAAFQAEIQARIPAGTPALTAGLDLTDADAVTAFQNDFVDLAQLRGRLVPAGVSSTYRNFGLAHDATGRAYEFMLRDGSRVVAYYHGANAASPAGSVSRDFATVRFVYRRPNAAGTRVNEEYWYSDGATHEWRRPPRNPRPLPANPTPQQIMNFNNAQQRADDFGRHSHFGLRGNGMRRLGSISDEYLYYCGLDSCPEPLQFQDADFDSCPDILDPTPNVAHSGQCQLACTDAQKAGCEEQAPGSHCISAPNNGLYHCAIAELGEIDENECSGTWMSSYRGTNIGQSSDEICVAGDHPTARALPAQYKYQTSNTSFAFSYSGPLLDMERCLWMNEPDDPTGVWSDNYLCWTGDMYNVGWFPISRSGCGNTQVRIYENAEPQSYGWRNNYICYNSGSFSLSYTQGPRAWSPGLISLYDPEDAGYWQDNYLIIE